MRGRFRGGQGGPRGAGGGRGAATAGGGKQAAQGKAIVARGCEPSTRPAWDVVAMTFGPQLCACCGSAEGVAKLPTPNSQLPTPRQPDRLALRRVSGRR